MPSFVESLATYNLAPLRAAPEITTLQVNVGKVCNQACKHCHVDAGPHRTESMTRDTVDHVLQVVRRFRIPTLDITGGAPELNPHFELLVAGATRAGVHVIVRHNFTVQFTPGMSRLPELFRDHRVEVIASLPYFMAAQTDAQRGKGVFDQSLAGMRRLNDVGYGMPGTDLRLNLVYNPAGAFLPPDQTSCERDFKRELETRYGLFFNSLYTITNMPISRFLDFLRRSGNEERYREKLVNSFNPAAVPGVMCRTLVSVGWDGRLYDCDFNQMLDMAIGTGSPCHISDFDPDRLKDRLILTGDHCFGCTAGRGSSCGGAVAP